jgi:hypothetical protein
MFDHFRHDRQDPKRHSRKIRESIIYRDILIGQFLEINNVTGISPYLVFEYYYVPVTVSRI